MGQLGLGLSRMLKDDRVSVFLGVPVPLIVRKEPDGTYVLVGEGYVHGMMEGKPLQWTR